MAYAQLIKPDSNVRLSEYDPGEHGHLSEEDARNKIKKLQSKLEDLQELLFAAGTTSLLIVLQGRDTSGKDGTIRQLSNSLNVQGVHVAAFKVPTPIEAKHDFLWRIHKETPSLGTISIFNRSHYEDVLAARVHKLVPGKVWKCRFDQINEFEAMLVAAGTVVIKFYLHISKEEQEQRLMDREADSTKAWKLSVGDWKERELWHDYTEAYEAILSKCSKKDAPWYLIPANHKWFRDLCVAEAVVGALEGYKKDWKSKLEEEGAVEADALKAFRASQK